MAIKCPKCGYERGPGENAPAWQCPQCKVAYTKVAPSRSEWSPLPLPSTPSTAPPPFPRMEEPILAEEMAVSVVDIKMPFMSMVTFMVKWAIASIPAFIILVLIGVASTSFIGGLASGFMKSDASKVKEAQEEAFSKRTTEAIKEKKVFIGMKEADVLRSWGEPQDKNLTQIGGTRIETWRYGGETAIHHQFLTLTDGIVTSISGAQG